MIRARHALLLGLVSCTPAGGSPVFVAAALVAFIIRRAVIAARHAAKGDASRPRPRHLGWRGG